MSTQTYQESVSWAKAENGADVEFEIVGRYEADPVLDHERCTIHCGDSLAVLKALPDESVNCCVTSPPYFNLRNYGHDGQGGGQSSLYDYTDWLVAIFGEVKRVLRDDGTLWIVIGDSYNGSGGAGGDYNDGGTSSDKAKYRGSKLESLPRKCLIGVPWTIAFAMRDRVGLTLRNEIIWSKPNPRRGGWKDRLTASHETILFFSKSDDYYHDRDAIAGEPSDSFLQQLNDGYIGSDRRPYHDTGQESPSDSKRGIIERAREKLANGESIGPTKTTVWTHPASTSVMGHPAEYPADLIEDCIKSSCPLNGTVLDPFMGSGTTAQVALEQGCNALGIELNPEYCDLIKRRLNPILEQGTLFK